MKMNASVFFKIWNWRVLTAVALGAVLLVAGQRMLWRHESAHRSALTQGAQTLPDVVSEAEPSQAEIPVAATPNESFSVSAAADVVQPAPALARETATVSLPPLALAVKVVRDDASVGIGPSENKEIPTVDPPLAFTVNPKNFTPAQQATLAAIQDQFLKAIGDADQNPADPAYNERWRNAQSTADQAYRADFGWTAFEQMQLERAQNSYTEIRPP